MSLDLMDQRRPLLAWPLTLMLSILLRRSSPLSKCLHMRLRLSDENWGLRSGYGFTSTIRSYGSSGCHLHSQGVNEIHTNSVCTKVLSDSNLKLIRERILWFLSLKTEPLVSFHASRKSEVSSQSPLIIQNFYSYTQLSFYSWPDGA